MPSLHHLRTIGFLQNCDPDVRTDMETFFNNAVAEGGKAPWIHTDEGIHPGRLQNYTTQNKLLSVQVLTSVTKSPIVWHVPLDGETLYVCCAVLQKSKQLGPSALSLRQILMHCKTAALQSSFHT